MNNAIRDDRRDDRGRDGTAGDTFVRDHLPPPEYWPDMGWFGMPAPGYPERLNCAAELLDRMVESGFGDRPAVYFGDRVWTYADLKDKTDRIVAVLVEEMALERGNRVLLRGTNAPMTVACWLAVVKAGGIVVATMPLLRARELATIIDKAQISHGLCDEALAEALASARRDAKTLARVLHYSAGGTGDAELERAMAAKSGGFEAVDTAADEPMLIAFTSGTTGKPKGTVHFHRDVLAMCDSFADKVLGIDPDDVFVGSPPLAFTFGLGALLAFPMRFGAATVMVEKFGPTTMLETVARYKCTGIYTAPTAYRAMLEHVGDFDLSSLRKCVSAGEHLPKPIWEDWLEATGVKIVDGIGSTEMLHIFISAAGDDIRPGATGKAVPGYEGRIVDELGLPLPLGQQGWLAVRGPTGCRYLDDLERQQTYVRHGWNITGDIYRQDEDGYFWFVARGDDMIISSGYNIAGPEVESCLLGHAQVAECAVVGAPDSERGEIVKAYIVLDDPGAVSDGLIRDLQDYVKANLAPYKYPRRIEFVAELPKTQTGKLQRFRLREAERDAADS